MSGNTSKSCPHELKEREVWMFGEVRVDYDTDWGAMAKVSQLLGVDGDGLGPVHGRS